MVVLLTLVPVSVPLAYLLALATFPAVAWLLNGRAGWWDLLHVLLGSVAVTEGVALLARLGRSDVRADGDGGLVLGGTWLDAVVPGRRVVSVTPGERSVVLRLRDPDDAVSLDPQSMLTRAELLRAANSEATTPEQATARISQWLATPGTTTQAPGHRRLAPSAVPALLAVVMMLAAWLTVRLG